MKPDLIFANAPFGKPGVDITKYIMENFPDANYAMLNTRTAFKKYYDKLACQYATIGKYLLGTNENLHWVEQAILLATNGWTEVVDNRKKEGGNKVGVDQLSPNFRGFSIGRTSHLVQMSQGQIPQEAYTRLRNATSVQLPRSDTACAAATHSRSATLVGVNEPYVYRTGTLAPRRSTHLVVAPACLDRAAWNHRERNATVVQAMDTKPTDVKLQSGYLYVSFDTFEEACECAIDIISWKNPTDSHYRCVRWGFVCGLIAHKK